MGAWGADRFTYNGKELLTDLDLGWNDYGARMYMSEIGRWGAVDPLGETTLNYSLYTYCLSNPIAFLDPTGLKSVWNGQYGDASAYYDDETGEGKSWDEVQSEHGINGKPKNAVVISDKINDDKALSIAFEAAKKADGDYLTLITASGTQNAFAKLLLKYNEIPIENLYIVSHGGYKQASFRIGNELINNGNISSKLKSLESLGRLVSENGNIVILACHTGSPTNGGKSLLTQVSSATQRTVFGNQSWGKMNPFMFSGYFWLFGYSQDGFGGESAYKPSDPHYNENRDDAKNNAGKWTKVIYNSGTPKPSTVHNVQILNGSFSYDTNE